MALIDLIYCKVRKFVFDVLKILAAVLDVYFPTLDMDVSSAHRQGIKRRKFARSQITVYFSTL